MNRSESERDRGDGAYGLTRAGKFMVGILISLAASIGWFTVVVQTNSATALEWVGWFPPLLGLVLAAWWRLRIRRDLMAIGVLVGAIAVAPVLFALARFVNGLSHWEF
jgi:hypothetical protein